MSTPNSSSAPRCPICQRPVGTLAINSSYPFCSPRCRAVDLGKWLGEEYRVPDRSQDEREDELPDTGGNGGADV